MQWYHFGLAALMLVTGSINTLSVKWADTMQSESSDGQVRGFNHPFLQACGMFLGEMLCMVVFVVIRWHRRRKRARDPTADPDAPVADEALPFNPLVFWPPALCDMTATCVQYIGLTLTYASSFQMLRGAVIIFTGLLSRFVLRRRFQVFRWVGIGFVITGLAVVGMCDMLYPKNGGGDNSTDTSKSLFHAEYLSHIIRGSNSLGAADNKTNTDILIGDVLIVCAQVIVASQMVYEEKFVSKYNVPALQAVGWEGTFGLLTLSTLLIPMYFIPVGPKLGDNPRHVMEDAYDGVYQLTHNPLLMLAFCSTIVSIAFFNFAGISVTKEMSATTRMVLDSIRTLVIWSVSLAVGWQQFHALQLLGFAVLVIGMCVYNNIIFGPCFCHIGRKLGLVSVPYVGLNDEDDDSRNSSTRQNESEENIFDPRREE